MMRHANRPIRRVVSVVGPRGCSNTILRKSAGRRCYELTLSCGHMVERFARYSPQPDKAARAKRGGWGWRSRSLADILPPPKSCRCEYCPPRDPPSGSG